jgi:hypothetical protein
MGSSVCVQVHDEITPKGGKEWSVTKEHPQGLKHKRLNFMQEDPLSWAQGWCRQNDASEVGKVQNGKRTHTCAKGRPNWAEMGLG